MELLSIESNPIIKMERVTPENNSKGPKPPTVLEKATILMTPTINIYHEETEELEN
jgi:hypothetical protein